MAFREKKSSDISPGSMERQLAAEIQNSGPLHIAISAKYAAGTDIIGVFFTADEAAHAVLRAQTAWFEEIAQHYYPRNRILLLNCAGPTMWRDTWARSALPNARVEQWQPYGDQTSVSYCNLDLYLKRQVVDRQLSTSEIDVLIADCCTRAAAGTATNQLSSIMASSAETFEGFQDEYGREWMQADDRGVAPSFAGLQSWRRCHGYALQNIN